MSILHRILTIDESHHFVVSVLCVNEGQPEPRRTGCSGMDPEIGCCHVIVDGGTSDIARVVGSRDLKRQRLLCHFQVPPIVVPTWVQPPSAPKGIVARVVANKTIRGCPPDFEDMAAGGIWRCSL